MGAIKKIVTAAFAAAALLAGTITYAPDRTASAGIPPLKAVPAPEWDNLFKRTTGWLGADGVYSIPLNGNRQIGSATAETKTFWTFADTNIGSVDPETFEFLADWTGTRNSAAVMTGKTPTPENITFFYGHHADMTNSNLYGENGEVLWAGDGIVIDDTIHLIATRVDETMAPQEIVMIHIPLVNGEPDFTNITYTRNLPLLYEEPGIVTISFGSAIYDNTADGGAPNPDGYVYIYGHRDIHTELFQRKLVVARVPKAHFTDVSQWRFYNNGNWETSILAVNNDWASLADWISPELSVTYINSGVYSGKYMLIYQHKTVFDKLAYRIGDTPYGPFGEEVQFYTVPEDDLYGPFYPGYWFVTYNAKAHPHLSDPGELLISYSPNVAGVFPYTSEVYRPRFVKLKLNEFADTPPFRPEVNVAAGKPVDASDNLAAAPNAVDGAWSDPAEDMWTAANWGPKWLSVDLGQPVEITGWLVRHASAGGEPAAYNTRDFELQKSDDGVNWTTVDYVSNNTDGVTRREVIPFVSRYVRLYITNPSQNGDPAARIFEFEVFKPAQTNVALGKPVTASGGIATASNAVDGAWSDPAGDKWTAASTGDKWLRVDLGKTYTITRWVVKHASYAGEATAKNTQTFKLQKSMNGIHWQDVDTVTGNTLHVTSRDVAPFKARYVRLYITKPQQGTGTTANIYEFEVYAND